VTIEATTVLTAESEPLVGESRRRGRQLGRVVRQNPLGFYGVAVTLIMLVFAIFAPVIAPYDPDDFGETAAEKSLDPTADHIFGTDDLGRDMFSRVVYGARISLIVGFTSVLFGVTAATMLGIFSGYVGGGIDNFIQRTVDTAIAFPALLLLLILRAIMGSSLTTLIIAVGIAIIPGVTRVVRGAVLSEKNNQYVEAARALGASTPRILFRHIAPNIIALSIIIMTSLLGTAILAEAALSFLGLGIPSSITWGQDVNAASDTYPFHAWQAFFPGAFIALTVMGFNLLGDSLRDIFDPRLRGRL
jgi:ABC-type dipeptide/oligopeptide/nickel transport system permease subunit